LASPSPFCHVKQNYFPCLHFKGLSETRLELFPVGEICPLEWGPTCALGWIRTLCACPRRGLTSENCLIVKRFQDWRECPEGAPGVFSWTPGVFSWTPGVFLYTLGVFS